LIANDLILAQTSFDADQPVDLTALHSSNDLIHDR
jgi:hypothetical protein